MKVKKSSWKISSLIEEGLQNNNSEMGVIAKKFKDKKEFYFLARGINFAIAGEGALN